MPHGKVTSADPAPTWDKRAFLCALMVFLYTFVLDDFVLPVSNGLHPLMFEVTTVGGIGFLALIGLLASRRPDVLDNDWFNGCAVTCSLAGAFVALESVGAPGPLYYLGSVLVDVGFEWALVVACLTLGELRLRAICAHAGVAALVAYGGTALMQYLPLAVPLACYGLAGPVAVVVAAPPTRRRLAAAAAAPPLADVSVTRPGVLPSLTNLLFVSIVVLMSAFGYSLGYDAHATMPLFLVVMAVFALVWVAATWRSQDLDLVYKVAGIIVLFGMFVSHPGVGSFAGLQAAALKAGALLVYYVEVVLYAGMAARSRSGGIALVALANAASLLGILLGSEVHGGVQLVATFSENAAYLLTVTIACAFVAFIVLAQRGFSLNRAVAEIEDPAPDGVPVPVVVPAPAVDLRGACAALAEEYGLTPRESEVLGLLVKGYGTARMEEALVISRNTVKTHVRHIYAKLGCHSQQELIDLAEKSSSVASPESPHSFQGDITLEG